MEEDISEFEPMEGLQSPVLQMARKPAHLKRVLTCKSNWQDCWAWWGLYTSKNVSFLDLSPCSHLKKKKRFSFPFWMQYIALELLYWQLCSVENASVIWTIIFSCRSISCPISSCDSHLMCRILVFYWALVLILSDLLIYVWYFNVLHN